MSWFSDFFGNLKFSPAKGHFLPILPYYSLGRMAIFLLIWKSCAKYQLYFTTISCIEQLWCASRIVSGIIFYFEVSAPRRHPLVSCWTALLFSAPASIGLRLLFLLSWVAAHVALARIGCNLSRATALLLAQLPSVGALLACNEAAAPIPLVEVSTSWSLDGGTSNRISRDVFALPINKLEIIKKWTTP